MALQQLELLEERELLQRVARARLSYGVLERPLTGPRPLLIGPPGEAKRKERKRTEHMRRVGGGEEKKKQKRRVGEQVAERRREESVGA